MNKTCRKVSTITGIRRRELLKQCPLISCVLRIPVPQSAGSRVMFSAVQSELKPLAPKKAPNSVPKATPSTRAAPAPPTPMKRWLISKSVRAPFGCLIPPMWFLSPRTHGKPVRGEIMSWQARHGHPESSHRGFTIHWVGAPGGHHLRRHILRGMDRMRPIIGESWHEWWAETHRGVWRKGSRSGPQNPRGSWRTERLSSCRVHVTLGNISVF